MSSSLQFHLSREGDSTHSHPHTWPLGNCSQFLKGKFSPKNMKSREGTKTYTKEIKSFRSKPFNVYLSLLFGKLKSHRETTVAPPPCSQMLQGLFSKGVFDHYKRSEGLIGRWSNCQYFRTCCVAGIFLGDF